MNLPNKSIAFVPGCMLCPCFQAVQNEKTMSWAQKIIPFFLENQIGLITMPCPEISFGGFLAGSERKPHNILYYRRQPGFVEHCQLLARPVVQQITEFYQAKFRIAAVVGIENSPTCAASRMFLYGVGTCKQQGIFLDAVSDGLAQHGISLVLPAGSTELAAGEIPLAGIDRSYPERFLHHFSSIMKLKRR